MQRIPPFAVTLLNGGVTKRVSQSLVADRAGDFIDLTARERSMLAKLEQRSRTLRRGMALQRENDRTTELFVVKQGIVMSYVLLPDGSRQILRFMFAGDIGGVPALLYPTAAETVVAVTEAVVAPFERTLLAEVLVEFPRLAGYLATLSQLERLALTDRLAALGRTSAKARVAALLLELRDRMRPTDKSIGDSYPLTLTQEEIGDAVGLTAVHVNRMLRQLEEEKLVARSNGRITLLDANTLARVSNYTDRFANIDLSWLPAAGE